MFRYCFNIGDLARIYGTKFSFFEYFIRFDGEIDKENGE